MSRANDYWPDDAGRGETQNGYFGLGDPDTAAAAVTPSGVPTKQADVPWYQTLIQTAVPALTTVYAQNQLTKTNIARINNGLPALTASEYAATYQPPSAQVQVGPDATAKRLMMYAGFGLLAYLGLKAARVIR